MKSNILIKEEVYILVYFYKDQLYCEMGNLKKSLGLLPDTCKINWVEFTKEQRRHPVGIKAVPFENQSLRGMASVGRNSQIDVILLNTYRNENEQNIDCIHELIHLKEHREERGGSFTCFDDVTKYQNPYLEWHANEGSAEIAVPYKKLLPIIKEYYPYLNNWKAIYSFKEYLASEFCVTSAVIKFRLENLKYEISQYISGVPLDHIKILSLNQQIELKINVTSLNELENRYLMSK